MVSCCDLLFRGLEQVGADSEMGGGLVGSLARLRFCDNWV